MENETPLRLPARKRSRKLVDAKSLHKRPLHPLVEDAGVMGIVKALSYLPLNEQARCSQVCRVWNWAIKHLLFVPEVEIRNRDHLEQLCSGFSHHINTVRFSRSFQPSSSNLMLTCLSYGTDLRKLILDQEPSPSVSIPKDLPMNLELLSCHALYLKQSAWVVSQGKPLDDDSPLRSLLHLRLHVDERSSLEAKEITSILRLVGSLRTLRSVSLSRIDLSHDNQVSLLFQNLRNLTAIELDNTGMTDTSLQSLAKMKFQNLRYLMVGSHEPKCLTDITDEGMRQIARMSTLEALDISYQNSISEAGFRAVLFGLKRLKFLSADGTGASDDVAAVLAKYGRGIQWLSLQSCNITNRGLAQLTTIPNLIDICITYCEKLTPDCVSDLIKSPKLENVELLDAKSTAGITHEHIKEMIGIVSRKSKPDLYMFCWMIKSMGKSFLPGEISSPIFSKKATMGLLGPDDV